MLFKIYLMLILLKTSYILYRYIIKVYGWCRFDVLIQIDLYRIFDMIIKYKILIIEIINWEYSSKDLSDIMDIFGESICYKPWNIYVTFNFHHRTKRRVKERERREGGGGRGGGRRERWRKWPIYEIENMK